MAIDQGDKLRRILQSRVERVFEFYLIALQIDQGRCAVDAQPFPPVGHLADMARGAVKPDHFKAGKALIARVDGGDAYGQSVRIGRAGGIGEEAEPFHIVQKRLARLHTYNVDEQRVRH